MFLLKIWSGKEIKFTQGLSEHAAFWGKFRAMFPKFIKFEQVQKLKRYLTSTVNFFDVTIDMLTRIFQTTDR